MTETPETERLKAVADGLMDEQMLSIVPNTRGQHHVVDYLPLRDAILAALVAEGDRRAEEMRHVDAAAVIAAKEAERLFWKERAHEGATAAVQVATELDAIRAERDAFKAALQWFIDDIDGTHTVMLDFDDAVMRARAALSPAQGGK